jgi:hypothetical protein
MGFKKCLAPQSSLPKEIQEGIQVIAAKSVQESFEVLFGQ